MKIIKVLNNSLVLVLDAHGSEKILMGKGIGFHKSIGDEVSETEIEKAFVANDDAFTASILHLADDIEDIYFELAKRLIDIAHDEYGMELLDYLYLALADHFSFVITRHRQGISLPSYINNNLQHFYPEHYKLGQIALELLEPFVTERLDENEAKTIAMHFVNAQAKTSESKLQRIDESIHDILNIVKYTTQVNINRESVAYSRFITHLGYFLTRLFKEEFMDDLELDIYRELREGYEIENRCVDHIEVYLKKSFGEIISDQERAYLVIHIHRLILVSQRN